LSVCKERGGGGVEKKTTRNKKEKQKNQKNTKKKSQPVQDPSPQLNLSVELGREGLLLFKTYQKRELQMLHETFLGSKHFFKATE